jgi:signal transduction histidine kinase
MDGEPRELHPAVQHEVSFIAREAVGNACMHAQASELRLELAYGDEFRLLVKDNGRGMEAATLQSGKPGHFGLQGMKERAARLRAKIDIVSSPQRGTEVLLKIPGNVAYRKNKKS